MDWHALTITPLAQRMQQELLDKHYLRKHGPNAYYGQKESRKTELWQQMKNRPSTSARRAWESLNIRLFTYGCLVPWLVSHQGNTAIWSRAVRWWYAPFEPHNAVSWHSKPPLLQALNAVQTIARLSAPCFLFDRLSQYPLSIFREYWDSLSNYLIDLRRLSLKRENIEEKFTKLLRLDGKWCFCHCPIILAQWSPYIAKYPWPPISVHES